MLLFALVLTVNIFMQHHSMDYALMVLKIYMLCARCSFSLLWYAPVVRLFIWLA